MRLVSVFASILLLASSGQAQNYTITTVAGGGLPENIAAASANLGGVNGVAADSSGNVYISLGSYNMVVRLDSSGQLTRLAGNGTQGYSGDHGLAANAQLSNPTALAVDASGNVYIVDSGNSRIRKVSGGVITTVAGNGYRGYSGDNGPATRAQVSNPGGLAVDASGNLYISDSDSRRVRKVSNGVIVTFAGGGSVYGDDKAPTAAQLSYPLGVAVDSTGNNVYIADAGYYRIRKVDITGNVITTVAGDGTSAYGGDNNPATKAQLSFPNAIALDSSNNLYISDSGCHCVRKVDSSSNITTVAGNGQEGFTGDGGSATGAELNQPKAIALDSAGKLYIADWGNNRVRAVSSNSIQTVAGTGAQANADQLSTPRGLAVDASGNIYVADYDNHRVQKISGSTVTTIAGTGAMGYGGDGGAASSAQLSNPAGLAVDAVGNLYIADTWNFRVRKISNGVINTIAGSGTQGSGGDGGAATSAQLAYPTGVAVDAAGTVYIADWGNNRVRMVSKNGVMSTLAGDGTAGYSGDGGAAASARLNGPWAVAVDASGNVYISDQGNGCIRKVTNGIITTVAGTGIPGFSGDNGPAAKAQLSPAGIALNAAGDLYVADAYNYRVRRISGGVITTIAGTGVQGFSGDHGAATSAQLWTPESVAVDASGNIYVADSGNHRVRRLAVGGTAGCSYSATLNTLGVVATGGNLNLTVHTGSNCSWTISGLPDWLGVAGNVSGTGSATITLEAAASSGAARYAALSIGGVSVPVRQVDSLACSGSGSCIVRALPHLVYGGEWASILFALNSGSQSGSYQVNFYDSNGNALTTPFPGGSALTGSVVARGLDYFQTGYLSASQDGWGLVTSDAAVTVHGVVRRAASDGNYYEAATPSSPGYSGFSVPFDATTFAAAGVPYYTGLAISNLHPSAPAHVTCVARDQSGNTIPNAVSVPTLNPLGHWGAFQFAALAGKRGTLDCTADTLVSAIAFRFIGVQAFSSLPVVVK